MGIRALLKRRGTLNIVQVGANDGEINDPIYKFVIENKDVTRILLIEPQPELIPFLKDNYKEHSHAYIFNGAIGPTEFLSLHRVRPSLWESFIPRYLKEAPTYRVPSGFASASRQFVLDHAAGNFRVNLPLEECVEEILVPCRVLKNLVSTFPFVSNINLLQIDTEGFDDVTIGSCNIDILKPSIINFEFMHLGAERLSRLLTYLNESGYMIFRWNENDMMAVRQRLLSDNTAASSSSG